MLPKKNRVDKRTVDAIFKNGRFVNADSLSFKFIKDPLAPTEVGALPLRKGREFSRISFIVPKSIAKLAVKRNFLRRKGYLALEKHLSKFPFGILGVLIFKKYQDDVSILENEIKNIFNKIN